jgi:hypothetical protein
VKAKKQIRKRSLFNLITAEGCVLMYAVPADEIAIKTGFTPGYIYNRYKEGRPIQGKYKGCYIYNDDEYDGIEDHRILYSDTEYDEFSTQWKFFTASILNYPMKAVVIR